MKKYCKLCNSLMGDVCFNDNCLNFDNWGLQLDTHRTQLLFMMEIYSKVRGFINIKEMLRNRSNLDDKM